MPAEVKKKDERQKNLEAALKNIEKQFGKGSVMRLGDTPAQSVEVISTGSLAVDTALGVGGVPRGRIIEIYGPESCLDAGSFVRYEVRRPNGKRQNHKGGTIERLYQRFNGIPVSGRGYYQRLETEDSEFFVPSVNDEGRIFQNRVVGVFSTGEKPCYEVTTESGRKLIATQEHRFYVEDGFVALGDLKVGDTVFIHNNTPYRVDAYEYRRRSEILVKSHPYAPTKIVEGKYEYRRLPRARAVVEADMNGLSLDEYRRLLNDGETEGLEFLSPEVHVHHIDENTLNDERSNLAVMTPTYHGMLHATDRHNNLRFMVVPEKIVSIRYAGTRSTYDIRVESPFNNYVANDLVVHNSGKTTLATHIMAQAQALGGQVAMIDAEHAFDPTYAEKLGVRTDTMLISQPDNGEQALNIADQLIGTGALDVIVIDSVAALVPLAEIEGEMGDSHVGLQARLMSQALRKITAKVHHSKGLVIFINQIREKIGVTWGSPETTTGGRALKFYASVRMDIRRIGAVKDGAEIIGNRTRVKVVKNKVAPPFREAEFDIIYGVGVDSLAEIVSFAVDQGLIKKSGSWYAYGEDNIGQGQEAVKQWLREDAERLMFFTNAVRQNLGLPTIHE